MESYIDRAIRNPRSLHRVFQHVLSFLVTKARYQLHGPDDIFGCVWSHLEWAEARRDDFVHMWFFFTFYVNFPEFKEMVDTVEMIAYPGTTEVTMAFFTEAVGQGLEDLQMQEFDLKNVRNHAAKFVEYMRHHVILRSSTFLAFPGFNSKTFIDTHDNLASFPRGYMTAYDDYRLNAELLARQLTKLAQQDPRSEQWHSISNTIARQQPLLQHMVVCTRWRRLTHEEVTTAQVAEYEQRHKRIREHAQGGEEELEELLGGGTIV
jgi:hypothetical protein